VTRRDVTWRDVPLASGQFNLQLQIDIARREPKNTSRICSFKHFRFFQSCKKTPQETRCQFHQRFTCSFYACRSQKRQMTLLTWLSFFAHSGSTCVKAVCRTLMKLSQVGCKTFASSFKEFGQLHFGTNPQNSTCLGIFCKNQFLS